MRSVRVPRADHAIQHTSVRIDRIHPATISSSDLSHRKSQFFEYFHGDNGAGLGASHQTGWTGVIARTMHLFATTTPEAMLEGGKAAYFEMDTTSAGGTRTVG